MTDLERTVFITAYRMALADGELSANEALLLHLFSKGLNLTNDELFHMKQQAEVVDLATLPETFSQREDQLALFETLCLVAMVDGRADPEEWRLVNQLTEIFEIDRDTAQHCLEGARARLGELSQQYDLLTEMETKQAQDAETD